jgi:hypothetical protein
LTPDAQKQITAMLAADTDNLTKHDIASEATWADKHRDSDNRRTHYRQTRNWHFGRDVRHGPSKGSSIVAGTA